MTNTDRINTTLLMEYLMEIDPYWFEDLTEEQVELMLFYLDFNHEEVMA